LIIDYYYIIADITLRHYIIIEILMPLADIIDDTPLLMPLLFHYAIIAIDAITFITPLLLPLIFIIDYYYYFHTPLLLLLFSPLAYYYIRYYYYYLLLRHISATLHAITLAIIDY
jgi:hypothetical protein